MHRRCKIIPIEIDFDGGVLHPIVPLEVGVEPLLDTYSRAVGLAALLLLVTAEAVGEAEHDGATDPASVVVVAPLRLISGAGYRRGALEEVVHVESDQQRLLLEQC